MSLPGPGDGATWPRYSGHPNDPRNPGCPCDYGLPCECEGEEDDYEHRERQNEIDRED